MLKKSRILFDALLQPVFALYLGFVFTEFFLKGLIPGSLAVPGAIISAGGFFLALRWLGKAGIAPKPATQSQGIKWGLLAPDRRHVFRLRKSSCRKNQGESAAPVRVATKGSLNCVRIPHAS